MRIWTDEQLAAISHGACKSALVSAAAGSGKTAVLVERVIRLLTATENPVSTSEIVLVTFTRKAAAEMKERLEKELKFRLSQGGEDSALLRLIQKQLIRLEEAQITTINAFCLDLLRENSGLIGLEPGFRVGNEEELELLSKQAMAETLEEFYDGEPQEIERTCEFFGVSSSTGGTSGDFNLRQAIRELYDFTRNLPDSQSRTECQLELFSYADRYFDEVVPIYYGLIKKEIEKAIELTHESLSLAEFDKTVKFLNGDLAFFQGYYEDYNYSGTFPKMNLDKNEDEQIKEAVRANRDKVKKIKEGVADAVVLIADFKNAVERLSPVINTLVRLERLYEENFAQIKRRNKVLDFPDSEHLCLKLLGEKESVRRRIADNYKLIIVDEFQDSNFLQYELFRLLDCNGGKLFLVGDLKQSIYGFRGADSRVFDEVSQNPDYEVMYLSRNFRSSWQVVDSVNRIFEKIMPGYTEKVALKPGRDISDERFTSELCLLSEDDFPDLDESDGIQAEARYTALRIKAIIADEDFRVFDRDKTARRCTWGDFAVLSSVGPRNFRVYERVFAEHGIPCVSSGGNGYLKTEEVALALDLLTVINNPYNDLSLFNIMLSPMYFFTAEEVAAVRIGRKKIPLYSALLAKQRKSPSPKIAEFLDTLSRYRRIADISSAAELISAINSDGGFLPLIAGSKTASRKANLRLLSYYAERFADVTQGNVKADSGLPSFLAYIKELDKGGFDVRQANVNSSDFGDGGCVKLLTIHGAKGLEFPICFVAGVNREFNFRGGGKAKKSPPIRFNPTAGIVADYFDEESLCRFKTLLTDYEKRLSRDFIIEEEKRKLYVAATRAECKLIFTGFAKGGKIRANSYAEWLVDTITPAEFSLQGEQSPLFGEGEKIPESEKVTLNRDCFERILANINSEYSRKILGGIPAKMTATQVGVKSSVYNLNAYEHDEPAIFPRNPSFHGERRLTGKKRGDAYHKAMELIDFKKGEYSEQLEALRPRFTPIEFKAINPSDIAGFFHSELGQRAVKSPHVVKEYKIYTEIPLSELGITADYGVNSFIQGIADMFFYEDGGIILVDYKTNRNTSIPKLIDDYRGQLLIYKKAIEEMSGDKVKECWIYSFEQGGIRV
ncbi:MAG: UvrD-helicase domain-containing protein [Oscillospiraceae bacterium]|nr:UvrD-helicase domain-containing protein [Oscillospiraceae bacterium]